LVLQAHELAVW